ncbi:hypothetical protein EDD18DRAFT_1305632 [Armillaria luteobubalina]|uniref:DDE Tnp4 domain-containing protein n=1 Tax=Armillaria luteobubalina TaxID=153913 RepID=A0AA39UYV2_9AGAR|nr:hypothetical protein EDD18DRAFT_1305632 [Armillaria luteobubalina]
MGLDIQAFTHLLDGGFAHQWNTNLIPWTDNPSTALDLLQELGEARIAWPEGEEFEENNALILACHPLLTGAFGSLDGLNLLVQTSVDQEIENATFNGWLHEHFVSSVFAFNAMGEIIACKLNAPGSWHDSWCQQLMAFDWQLLSYQQTAEWGNQGLQGSFGWLRVLLSVQYKDLQGDLLEVCVCLFNYRARTVGYNQIWTVYMPIWRDDGQEEIWHSFENLLFSDQCKNDQVSKFYNIVVN